MDSWQTVATIATALGVREVVGITVRGLSGRGQTIRAETELMRRRYERSRHWRMELEAWAHRVRLIIIGHGIPEEDIPPLPPTPPEIETGKQHTTTD